MIIIDVLETQHDVSDVLGDSGLSGSAFSNYDIRIGRGDQLTICYFL